MAKLTDQINDAKNALATHDHSDYQGLSKRMKEISALEADVAGPRGTLVRAHRTARLEARDKRRQRAITGDNRVTTGR